MNRIRALAALALLCAATASAQTDTPDSALAIALGAQPPIEMAARSADIALIQRPAINARRAQRDADARHCLANVSNRLVHRCAERYRTRPARARGASTDDRAI